jgi:hypothetical protein
LVVGIGLLLGACGDAEHTYVEEPRSGLFVRLPPDWSVFPVDDGNPAGDPRRDPTTGRWSVIVDGAEVPSRSHAEDALPDAPLGNVQITPLAMLQERLPLAQATLRRFFTADSSDPLVATATIADLEYEEIDLGHAWGNRVEGTMNLGAGEIRVVQLAFFDDGGDRLYRFRLLCSLACFVAHEAEINEVMDSFTLEG